MILTNQLELNPQEFQRFYANQLERGEQAFRKRRLLGIIKSIVFGLGGVLLILASSVKFNLVPIGMTSFLFGCYYFYIWAKLESSFLKNKLEIEKELKVCLAKLSEDKKITILVNSEEVRYYENGELFNSSEWNYISVLDQEEDQLAMALDKLQQLVKIRSFEVGSLFYDSFLSQLKSGFRISA